MDPKQKPLVLLAMASEARGQALLPIIAELDLEAMVVTDVETLLYHTRGSAPAALVIEHALVARVSQLDLIALLRRRKPLAEMPLLCLGPKKAEIHAALIRSGADVYLELPTQPSVISVNLKRLWDDRQLDLALRETLTGLRTMEKAYKESERMKDDLTHMLVHDLKSPIASVMGLLDHSIELIKGTTEAETPVELLTLARVEAQHLLNLAANILDVRRMKEGHMPYNPEKVYDVTELAKVALQDVSGTPRERNFGFLVRPEAEVLYADPSLLRRILANLLGNAIKHTRRGGYIDFRAWRQDDVFVLSVRDDGEGIPEQDQKRIFNAFEQSRHTVHDRYDTGMGLTFCKLAVEKHGGKIWVESKVGRGSTFYFTLPANVEEDIKRKTLVEDIMPR
jgi:signal transduction histidine kinase